MNGLGWIFRGEDSLVYFLCNLGYDVWVINLRGTEYSRQHTSLSTSNIRYWYYSIHELGIYDKAIYIGYSMGTTSFYIYSTVFPDEAEANLKGMVGLGPAINFKGAKSLLQISAYVWPVLKPIINTLWHGEIIPGYTSVFELFLKTSGGMYFMQTLINLIAGFDYDQMDAISYPLLSKWFDTAAVNVWTHFLQIYRSRIFQHYDYGFTRNMIIYGQLKPPPYNISKISIPVALFVGKSDWLAPVPIDENKNISSTWHFDVGITEQI
ncbi:hypothetical protein NQ318_007460 [Aromia moschata]|uniref:AB hydrolase-1 domain-containing protein n=1 Tax=Aromia moschata TaxID=1265417 RepID=A0AAV8YL91_9CUCU|nr:hypothetical protein NQ318_007460 [Aromia moschata]